MKEKREFIESRRYNWKNESGKEFYERIRKERDDEGFFRMMREKYWPIYKAAQEKDKCNS